MQFLRTLFWVLLAVLLAVFAINNWNTVPVKLGAGLTADINLPLLLLLAFLIGFVPLMVLYRATRWRLHSRITALERTVSDLRASAAPPLSEPVLGHDAAVPLTPATPIPPL